MDTLYIVMPAYNEQDNIKKVVNEWYELLEYASEESKLIVADSGSQDNTHNILQKMKNDMPKLEIIETSCKLHGPKVISLYDYAIKNNADFVFQTDSDGQTSPNEFKQFWVERNNHDGIFGHRKVRSDGKGRAFVEKTVCVLLKIYFNVDVYDANAPYRLMKCNILKHYLPILPKDFKIPNIMITTFFAYFNHNIKYFEITFKPRTSGKNSINFIQIVKIGIRSLIDFGKFKKILKSWKNNNA